MALLHLTGLLGCLPPLLSLSQLPAEVPLRVSEERRPLKVLVLDGPAHLPARLGGSILQLFQLWGQGLTVQAGSGGGLIYKVDGLVGQKPLGQIADR